ncbi:hypothetical protein ACFX58_06005 [Sphingomonas sp. NCPPB 2930]
MRPRRRPALRGGLAGATFGLLVLLGGPAAQATEPLRDMLEIGGETVPVEALPPPGRRGAGGLDLPPSDLLRDMARAERCSALGGPRGVYRVDGGRLWLMRLRRCGGDFALHEVFGGSGEPVMATWISADLVAQRGPVLCSRSQGGDLRQTTLRWRVEDGVVRSATEVDNRDSPAVPGMPPGARRALPCRPTGGAS